MLGQLHIKNIGIIDEITINFEEGLNILTGETGAGKSLIIDSINTISGGRISKELVKTGADMAFIEACFFEEDENIIVSREIYPNGRNISKINGKMVTVAELKELGESLIDIHGQHDNQSLLNPKTHLELLDSFASKEIKEHFEKYKNLLLKHKEIKQEINRNYGDETERIRRIDLLKYQKNEIEVAKLNPKEEKQLIEKHNLFMNAEKIVRTLNSSYNELNDKIIDALGIITRELESIANIDEKYNKLLENTNEPYYLLQDIAGEISKYIEEVDFSEEEQFYVEERLNLIETLKKKYGNSIEEILKYYNKLCEELNFLENSEEITNKLKEELKIINMELKKSANEISKIREKVAIQIENEINKQLQDLEMKKSFLKFQFKKSEDFLETGMDIVQLMICTNLGEELKPLNKIASGGEISRVMLAIKTVLGKYDSVPTMIFDEIDTGISGQAGKAVAEKLKLIAKTHQILCVTHLPTIAAAGNANYFIQKQTKDEKTLTSIRKLNEEETIYEIARIISGDDITKAVLENAKELRKK